MTNKHVASQYLCSICDNVDGPLEYIPAAQIALCVECYEPFAMMHRYDFSPESMKRTEDGLRMMGYWLQANPMKTIH